MGKKRNENNGKNVFEKQIPFSRRVIAFCIMLSYCTVIAPAKELLMEQKNEKFFIERYEIESDVLSEEEKAAVENAINGNVVCDEVFWGEFSGSEENAKSEVNKTISLIHSCKLYENLITAKDEYLQKNRSLEKTNEQYEEEWKEIAERLVEEYLAGCDLHEESEKNELREYFIDIEKSLYNKILSELLYDKYSLKKEADKDAAGIVTEQLISEVEAETENNLDALFEKLKVELNYDETSFAAEKDEWFKEFQKYIDDGITKWQKLETEFLEAKFNFENKAGEKYSENIDKWMKAYENFLDRKNQWNNEIEQKLSEGIVIWQQKSESLNLEIEKVMEDYKNELLSEYKQKNEEFKVNCEIYTHTRTLLSTTCDEVDGWFVTWSDKYDGIYSYWKTEDNEKNEITGEELKENPLYGIGKVDQSNCSQIKKIVNDVKNLYKITVSKLQNTDNESLKEKYSTYLSEDQILWNELELVDNWLGIISDYSVTLDECIKNLEAAGFDYSDSTFILGSDYIKEKQLEDELDYYADQVEILKAVYEYSINNTSSIENKIQTEENLRNAELKTDKALEEYQKLSEKLQESKNKYSEAYEEYEKQKNNIQEILKKLKEAQTDYKKLEINISFSDFYKHKEEYISCVNSINQITTDFNADKENLIKLNQLIENYAYYSIYQDTQKLIDSEYDSYEMKFEGQNGNKLYEYVKGITELEKEYEKTKDEEILSELNTKKEIVNFLKYGQFYPGDYENVDYDAIVKGYSRNSVDYCIEQDKNTKNDIWNLIQNFKRGSSDNYLQKSDDEVTAFFGLLDNVVENSLCSDYVKSELDMYKNQIMSARSQYERKQEMNAFYEKINDVFGKNIYVNQYTYDIESFEIFFDVNSAYYDENFAMQEDEYNFNYSKLFNLIYDNQKAYGKNRNQLLEKGNNLISENEDYLVIKRSLDNAKENVSLINQEYSAALEKCNGNENNSCFNILKNAMKSYNELILQVEEKYNALEKCRHEENICREIYNYAENEYLHLGSEYEDFVSVEDKYSEALNQYENIKGSLADLKKNNGDKDYNQRFELFDDAGNNVLKEYENAAKNYCALKVVEYEINERIEEQTEKLYKFQLEEESLFHQIIKETDSSEFTVNEYVKEFVVLSKEIINGKEQYSIKLNVPEKQIAADESEVNQMSSNAEFDDLCKEYVTEKVIGQYNKDGDFIYYSNSAVDSINFLNDLSQKEYTIDDLLLALCYVKMNYGKEVYYYEGENPNDDKNFSLPGFSEQFQAIKVFEEYKNGRLNAVKEAYEKVLSHDGLDDIARLLFYASYNYNESFDLQKRETDWISIKGLEHLCNVFETEADTKNELGITFSVSAATMGVMAAFPLFSWAIAFAVALEIAAYTYFTASNDLKTAGEDIRNVQNNYRTMFDEIVDNSDAVIDKWIDSRKNVKNQIVIVNNLLYGIDEESENVMTFEVFDKQMKTILSGSTDCSVDYNYLSNLYSNNDEIDSLEKLFNKAVKDQECYSVVDVLNCISDYLTENYKIKVNEVSYYADESRSEENWNESLYQREIGKIALDSFVVDVPIKINREQESYVTTGFSYLEDCYNNMLYEYYSKLLLQKENELEFKIDQLNKEYIDWITEIKSVKEIAENEWNKAEQELNNRFSLWNEQWKENYFSVENEFEENYENFIKQKAEWINEKYTQQSLGFAVETADNRDFENIYENIMQQTSDIIANSKSLIDSCGIDINLDNLLEADSFNNISNYIDSLDKEAIRTSINIFNEERINLFDLEKNERIEKVVSDLNEKIEKTVSMLSAANAQKTINDRLDELYCQIDLSNKEFENWEKELVLKDGYNFGDEISRYAVVNSIVFGGNIREKQTVHKYEYFDYIKPEITFNYADTDSLETVSLMLEKCLDKLKSWQSEIFGTDEAEGLFSKHIGTRPEFVENVNINKNRVENISDPGNGQMGLIMLDFIWNSEINRNGYAELGVPLYEKKITKDNKFLGIELPTIRDITSIICDIASNVTGQVWISVLDDALFGLMDLDFCQKSVDEVIKGWLKAGVSMGAGAAASGAIKAVGNTAMNVVSKSIVNAGIKTAQTYTTSIIDSYIDAASFTNGFSIDWEKANSSWTNENILRNSISSGLTYATSSILNTELNNLSLTDGLNKPLNDNYFNVSAVKSLNKTISNIAAAGVEKLITGETTINLFTVCDCGLLAVTLGDNGISAKFSNDGIDLNALDAINGISGIADAVKVTAAKCNLAAGDDSKISLLNGINCLSYSSSEGVAGLAKEIWSGEKVVNIKTMEALGRVKGNVIEISDKLKGNNDESAVQIASTILHEDVHSNNGNELLAREIGYQFYDEMSQFYDTSQGLYDNVSDIAFLTQAYKQYGEEGLFIMLQLSSAFSDTDDGWEYYFAETVDPKWRQKRAENNAFPLGDGWNKERINEYNSNMENKKYNEYMVDGYTQYLQQESLKDDYDEKKCLSFDLFCESGIMEFEDKDSFVKGLKEKNESLKNYQFTRENYIGLGDYGCVVSTAAYIAYSLTGKPCSLIEANELCKNAGLFEDYGQNQKTLLSWSSSYVDAVNIIAGEEVLSNEVYRVSQRGSMNYELNEIERSKDEYYVIGRVNNNGHAVLIKDNQNDYKIKEGIKFYNSLDVINPWDVETKSKILEKNNYSLDEISNLTFYKVKEEYKEKKENKQNQIKNIKQLYYK